MICVGGLRARWILVRTLAASTRWLRLRWLLVSGARVLALRAPGSRVRVVVGCVSWVRARGSVPRWLQTEPPNETQI